MKWLSFAYGFLFFANLVFMAVAGYILYRIQDTVRQSRVDLLKAASLSMEAGKQLKLAAKRTANDLERVVQAHHMRDNTHSRALEDLSFQIKNINDHLQRQGLQTRDAQDGDEEQPSAQDIRAKLQAELNKALAQNHSLQAELEMAELRMMGASQASATLQEELKEHGGFAGQMQMAILQQRTQDLQAELEQARERARKAEQHAQENASQLDAIRAQINSQRFDDTPSSEIQQGVDVLTQDHRQLQDKFAEREKTLLKQIDKLEQALKRQATEQSFIEDHFLKMEADQSAPAAAPQPK